MNGVRGEDKKQCELGNKHSSGYSHGNDGPDVTTEKKNYRKAVNMRRVYTF